MLDYKIRFVDKRTSFRTCTRTSSSSCRARISLMHIVLEYLMKRVEKLGVCKPEQSNLFVALDEAFVNAVKHGNKFDAEKIVRITADVSKQRSQIYDRGRRRRL